MATATTEHTVTVPRGTGKAGLLRAMAQILELPRVVAVRVDVGKVTYLQREEPGADDPMETLAVDFADMMPYALIRSRSEIQEVSPAEGESPSTLLMNLLTRVTEQRLFPSAFVTGANTDLWSWLRGMGVRTTSKTVGGVDYLFGYPVYRDPGVDDYVLLLGAAEEPGAELDKLVSSYKIVMEAV